jgi:hypothetical protein
MARDGRAEQRAGCSAYIGLGLYMRAYTAVTAQSCYLINFAPRSWRGAHASISFRFFEQLTERDEGHLICTKHSIQPLQSAAEFRQHNSNAPGSLVSCTPKSARFLRHVGRCMSKGRGRISKQQATRTHARPRRISLRPEPTQECLRKGEMDFSCALSGRACFPAATPRAESRLHRAKLTSCCEG